MQNVRIVRNLIGRLGPGWQVLLGTGAPPKYRTIWLKMPHSGCGGSPRALDWLFGTRRSPCSRVWVWPALTYEN